jgi:ADP-ribosylglycohydrolase
VGHNEPAGVRARVRGCLLGGAVGDALGAPVEFMSLPQIQAFCGEGGVREYLGVDDGGVTRYGLVTDDTQMTLFTAEGLIRAGVRTDRVESRQTSSAASAWMGARAGFS